MDNHQIDVPAKDTPVEKGTTDSMPQNEVAESNGVMETVDAGWQGAKNMASNIADSALVHKIEEGVDSIAHVAAGALHLSSSEAKTDLDGSGHVGSGNQEKETNDEADDIARDQADGPGAAGCDELVAETRSSSEHSSEVGKIARDHADGPSATDGDPAFAAAEQSHGVKTRSAQKIASITLDRTTGLPADSLAAASNAALNA